jgi:hypothetical protein
MAAVDYYKRILTFAIYFIEAMEAKAMKKYKN